MSKILDAEFRKVLYKNLTDAGYGKTEAQKIIGTKYYDALKESVKISLNEMLAKVETNVFDFTFNDIAAQVAELTKLKEIIS